MKTMTFTPIRTLLARFKREDSGVAMYEFAIVMPFLFAAWLGVAAVADSQQVSTKVSRVTQTVADIIAQSATVNSTRANTAFQAIDAMLDPTNAAKMQLYVAGLEIDNNGRAKVKWSYAKRGPKPGVGSTYTLPPTLRSSSAVDFVVVAKGSLKYKPIFGDNLIDEHTMVYEHLFSPRVSDDISVGS
ncbi:MAG: TadE/TadG family type IV pilus assembly protein [Pseudomonadota bacterium]